MMTDFAFGLVLGFFALGIMLWHLDKEE